MGLTLTWLSVIILIPLAGLFLKTLDLSFEQFWGIITSRRTLNALKISFGLSFAAACVNLVMGMIVVWALVRYKFPGRRLFDAIVDIPFALPTAVAGVALALPLTRLLNGFLAAGVRPWDPLVFAAMLVTLFVTAGVAIWLPSRRAARVDPVECLRCD